MAEFKGGRGLSKSALKRANKLEPSPFLADNLLQLTIQRVGENTDKNRVKSIRIFTKIGTAFSPIDPLSP